MLFACMLVSTIVATGPDGAPPSAGSTSLADAAALQCRFDPSDASVSLGLMAPPDESAVPEAVEDDFDSAEHLQRRAPWGASGSRYWYLQGGFAPSEDQDNSFGMVGVGVSHFIADGLSLDVELNGMYFQQEIQDAQGLNAGLLLRWHIVRKRDWSFFIDGGTGILVSTQDVPADGSSVNFASQAGLGFTLDLGGDTRLLTGVRWHHISNARLYDTNPGRDSILIYAGLTFPF